jgi:uncharacterized repeat protein (TIGR03803 family)
MMIILTRIITAPTCVAASLILTACGGSGSAPPTTAASESSSARRATSYKLLYNFKGCPKDGADPAAGLTVLGGKLYGTTEDGGSNCANNSGTAFSVTTAGKEHVVDKRSA